MASSQMGAVALFAAQIAWFLFVFFEAPAGTSTYPAFRHA
jgi:hypothetical protein